MAPCARRVENPRVLLQQLVNVEDKNDVHTCSARAGAPTVPLTSPGLLQWVCVHGNGDGWRTNGRSENTSHTRRKHIRRNTSTGVSQGYCRGCFDCGCPSTPVNNNHVATHKLDPFVAGPPRSGSASPCLLLHAHQQQYQQARLHHAVRPHLNPSPPCDRI